VFPALEIGKMIRIRGFSTAVQDARCNSACAFIWLAGSPRVMNNAATIGFHAPYVDGKNGKKISTAVQGARIGAYLATLGFSEDVVSFAVTGSAEEVRWLNKKPQIVWEFLSHSLRRIRECRRYRIFGKLSRLRR